MNDNFINIQAVRDFAKNAPEISDPWDDFLNDVLELCNELEKSREDFKAMEMARDFWRDIDNER